MERICFSHTFFSVLMSSRLSFTSSGEGASITMVGHYSSDGVTIKVPDGVDILLHRPALHCIFPSFPIGLVKTESDFFTFTLVVYVISVDGYPFLAFSDLTCYLEDTGIGVFWLHCIA